MHIIHVTAGAGSIYCGACTHDHLLAQGLAKLGCDVDFVPLYTRPKVDAPLTDAPTCACSGTFFCGVNVYLEQHIPFFRRPHRLLDRITASDTLLRLAGRLAARTDPAQLGAMTVSMLRGHDGFQRREFARLLAFLEAPPRTDVILLTNSLLSAIAPAVKAAGTVPVVCELQGEDGFVEAMPDPHRTQARELMQRNARAIDLFLAPSERHAAKMIDFLAAPSGRFRVVRPGIDTARYALAPARPRSPFTIGCLSRIAPEKGLDLLVEASQILICEQGRDVRIRAAGRVTDRRFWADLKQSVRRGGLASRFVYEGELDFADKVRFLHGCSAFCVPSRFPEIRGTAAMEAMAVGLPVVAARAGIFDELAERAGGVLLATSENPRSLAAALSELMDDPDRADALGRAAREGVQTHHDAARTARETLQLCTQLVRVQ